MYSTYLKLLDEQSNKWRMKNVNKLRATRSACVKVVVTVKKLMIHLLLKLPHTVYKKRNLVLNKLENKADK